MSGALKVAEQLLVSQLISSDFPISGKTKAGLSSIVFLGVLSGLLIFVGLGFFIYAAHLWLMNNFNPDVAAALTGCLTFAVAGMSGLSAMAVIQYKKSKAEKLKQDILYKIMQAINVANDEFGEQIKENPKTVMTAATLAGFAVGNRIQ